MTIHIVTIVPVDIRNIPVFVSGVVFFTTNCTDELRFLELFNRQFNTFDKKTQEIED